MIRPSLLFASSLLAAAVPASADEVAEWSRVSSPNENFSAEVPCNAAQIAFQRDLMPEGAAAAGDPLISDPPNRVMCIMSGDEIYLAALLVVPEAASAESSLFDSTVRGLTSRASDGEPRFLSINGHRAYVNQEVRGGSVAESGLIEAGRTSVVLFNAASTGHGEQPDFSGVNRFRDSIRIETQ